MFVRWVIFSLSLVGCSWCASDGNRLAAAQLVFTEVGFGDTVTRRNTSSGTQVDLIAHHGLDPRAVAVDRVNRHIYYAYGTSISRINFDGSGQTDLISVGAGVGVSALGLDTDNEKIYYATSSGTAAARAIRVANFDGTGVSTIHDNASLATIPGVTVNLISNLEVNALTGTLYWTADNGAVAGRTAFNSSPTSGGLVTQHWVASSRLTAINDLEIDFEGGKLYYTVGSETAEVRRSNFDNSALETLVSGVGRPQSLEIDLLNDALYFNVGFKLYQSDLEGSGLTSSDLGSSDLYSVAELELLAVPEPASSLAMVALGGYGLLRRRR